MSIMASRSNLSVLTQSHKAVAAKKRAKKEQIKEIVFDDDARRYVHTCNHAFLKKMRTMFVRFFAFALYLCFFHLRALNALTRVIGAVTDCDHFSICSEFLTGFHKRKVEKKDALKKRAIDREKQERLETRREACCCCIPHPCSSLLIDRNLIIWTCSNDVCWPNRLPPTRLK